MVEVLDILEPLPVEPPLYSSVAPFNGKPVFDDIGATCHNDELPGYTSSVYKLSVFQRKLEWTSPYEMAQLRHWTCCIVELNNTQLNIYQCPLALDDPLMQRVKVQSSYSSQNSHSLLHPYHYQQLSAKHTNISAFSSLESRPYNESQYTSTYTTKTDLQALKTFKGLHLLDSTNIIRSYSLQYGKVGLAIDYKKKHFVLRLRLECEQFMLEFPCSEAIIEWYNAITLGIDNALELNRRELPKFRSVPRRRRRRAPVTDRRFSGGRLLKSNRDLPRNSSYDSLFNRKPTSTVANQNSERTSIVGKFLTGFKLKKGEKRKSAGKMRGRTDSGVSVEDVRNALKSISMDDNARDNVFEDEEDEEEEDSAEEEEEEDGVGTYDVRSAINGNLIDSPSNGVNVSTSATNDKVRTSVSSRSTAGSSMLGFHRKNSTTPNTSTELFTSGETPLRRYESYIAKSKQSEMATYSFRLQRKILKDAMRCIPPMIENEKWANKFIVLDFNEKYVPQDPSVVLLHFKCQDIVIHLPGVGPQYVHKFQRKLQEWVVTPSGMIPCINMGIE